MGEKSSPKEEVLFSETLPGRSVGSPKTRLLFLGLHSIKTSEDFSIFRIY